MYGKIAGGAGLVGTTAAASLPVTGLSVVWMMIGGIAMVGLGGALMRFVPRQHH